MIFIKSLWHKTSSKTLPVLISSYYYFSHLDVLIDVWYLALRSISPLTWTCMAFENRSEGNMENMDGSLAGWRNDRTTTGKCSKVLVACQENYNAPHHKFFFLFRRSLSFLEYEFVLFNFVEIFYMMWLIYISRREHLSFVFCSEILLTFMEIVFN